MELRDIRTAKQLKGARVLLRTSLNVPLEDGVVANDFRLARALPTMTYLREQGARTIMVGHIGREQDETLMPVFSYLKERFPLKFIDIKDEEAVQSAVESMQDGDVLLLENVRSVEGETKNDVAFVSFLASLADMYVNDAFAASHREHASVAGVPKRLPSYAGIQLQTEVAELASALSPKKPALFILGGAKFETKRPLIEKFLDVYEHIFVGGALANDFFKAQGLEVGCSLVSEERVEMATLLGNKRIMVPIDVVVANNDGVRTLKEPHEIGRDESILDAGPKSVEDILEHAKDAAFILWNGPLGNYEHGFNEQTEMLAEGLAKLKVPIVVGGGDTVAAISKLNLFDKFSFVSTGGGAMLEYLEHGTLPGIEALTHNEA